jgi:hypothetical protein
MTRNNPPTPEELARISRVFKEKDDKQRAFIEQYGHMRKPNVVRAGKTTYSVIEGKIYAYTTDEHINFMSVLHEHALMFFGNDYLDEEEQKPFEKRHPAVQWMNKFVEIHNGDSGSAINWGSRLYGSASPMIFTPFATMRSWRRA